MSDDTKETTETPTTFPYGKTPPDPYVKAPRPPKPAKAFCTDPLHTVVLSETDASAPPRCEDCDMPWRPATSPTRVRQVTSGWTHIGIIDYANPDFPAVGEGAVPGPAARLETPVRVCEHFAEFESATERQVMTRGGLTVKAGPGTVRTYQGLIIEVGDVQMQVRGRLRAGDDRFKVEVDDPTALVPTKLRAVADLIERSDNPSREDVRALLDQVWRST